MNFRHILPFAFLGLLASACDNNDSPAAYKPGEKSDAPGIFFNTDETLLSVTEGEDTHIYLPVNRISGGDELTVPLVVNCEDPNVVFPESVTFPKGETQTSIDIDLADLEVKKLVDISITFPDEYINPYSAGTSTFEGSVLVSSWELVSDEPVEFTWTDWSYVPSTIIDPLESYVYYLPGTDRFKVENFLNTGYDFTFDLQASPYPGWEGYYRIMPLAGQVLYSEYGYGGYYNSWWFTDETKEIWPSCELYYGGRLNIIYGATFMWYDDEYGNEYCFMRKKGTLDANGQMATKNSAYMVFYGFYNEDWDYNDYTGYLRLHFEF